MNNKQKKYLVSLANSLKATVIVGKDGITYNLVESLNNALNANELVKVSVLKSFDADLKTLGFDLAMNTKSILVQSIGRTLVFYKKSKDGKIILP